MNISSIVVDSRPERRVDVQQALSLLEGVEIHAVSPEGKLVVTVETSTDAGTTDLFAQISAVDGVMSVALVYHQFEPEEEPCHGTDPT
jgi:nitrate reductase NapD